ncbi:MAG TPA: DNA recombination protein RmuC [Candidatus Dormibacteraeota bacterium]|nr:DNA recombination protein RmuC [Candidatus Dormibacteraeota bacterium]
MIEGLIIAVIALLVILIALVVFGRRTNTSPDPVMARLDALESTQDRISRDTKAELSSARRESAEQQQALRGEVSASLKNGTDSLVQTVDKISLVQQQRLEEFSNRLAALRQVTDASGSQFRVEITTALGLVKKTLDDRLSETATTAQQQFESFARRIAEFGQTNQDGAAQTRAELSKTLKEFNDSLQQQMHDTRASQTQQFESFALQITALTDKSEKRSDELRTAVETKLSQIQADNATKLDAMRATVDEKLQGTLEKRLGESFKLVSDRLELVHKGLGEMQTLASGVGDLKKVLTNVKTRGNWGEMQLGNLLQEMLTADQYGCNVKTRPGSSENVEFAIKLPGPDESSPVWLPIDAKFPKEDYEHLVDASERGDAVECERATKNLEASIRAQARLIRDKYIGPPHTTDFGLLYLPTEGLYAEILRRPGLVDSLQRELRVVVVGPTTLAAVLNSLQMGFRTLAIQKRSSEVWKVLGAVKTEFGKFGNVLDKVKKKIDETGNTIEEAVHRSRQIERKLRKVEVSAVGTDSGLLEAGEGTTPDGDEEEMPD